MELSSSTPDQFAIAEAAAAHILSRSELRPQIALVLGSGLGGFADELENATRIPYSEIPSFPRSTAVGHAGKLVVGTVDGVAVAAMQGRVHLYEGYSAHQVALPMRIFGRMGVKAAVLTNAAGGINPAYGQGALVADSRSHQSSGTESPCRSQRRSFWSSFSRHDGLLQRPISPICP